MSWNMLALLLAAPRDGASGGLVLLIQIAAFAAIFYFLLFRPQRKMRQRHEELLKALQKGDEVMTEGGVIGEVVTIKEERITIKSGTSTLVVARPKIVRVFNKEAAAPAEGAKK